MNSRRPLRRRTLTAALASIVTGATLLTSLSTAVAAPSAEDDRPTIAPADPLLDRPLEGPEALTALGEDLSVAADRNDVKPSALRTLLRSDDTVWVDEDGLVFFVDPLPAAGQDAEPQQEQAAPLAQTFALHSNDGANLTIFLDVDGADVSGTAWNSQSGVTPGSHPAWDPAGNGSSFSDSEKLRVQQVWAMVAEDYAPFDVDVTTQDPGAAGLVRSSSADSVYGTRVLITPSSDPFDKICQSSCGGVAYLGVFDSIGSAYQPAWVFPQALGNSAKNIAEAASHEAGHNLGLRHDGLSTQDYYAGQGVWAPIMGVGYGKPLVQWSAGSYPDANNQQDDISILTGYLGARADEASGSVATPSPLPTDEATIGTRADVDAYLLGSCTAGSTVTVAASGVAPNLDVRAVLRDANGNELATSQPESDGGDGTTAGGVGGSLTVSAATAGSVLTVEGVGQGAWETAGYDDYGSLGTYTVSAPGCDGAPADDVPGDPLDVAAGPAGEESVSLSWSAPASSAGGPVTGYVVTRSGSAASTTLPAEARSHTFTGLTAGTTYQLSVRAVNAAGSGRSVTVSATTAAPTPTAPSAPRDVTGGYDRSAKRIEAFWTEPASAGTQPISGYAIHLDGVYLGQLDPTSRGVHVTDPSGFDAGDHTVEIAAVNAVGSSARASVTVTVDFAPDAPTGVTATRGDSSATITWTAPDSNGSPITGYVIDGLPGNVTKTVGGASTSSTVTGLTNGTSYSFTVRAVNDVGSSAASASSGRVTPAGRPATPVKPTAKAGKGYATVSWKAPSANGTGITSYKIRRSDGTIRTVKGTLRTYRWTGLKKGKKYSFKIYAVNAVGTGNASPSSSTVTIT